MFNVGDVIRNKRPYFGEHIWRISYVGEKYTTAVQVPGRHGAGWDNPKHHMIYFNHQLECYRKAKWWEPAWLNLVGLLS